MLRQRPNLALRGELSLISDFWKQTFESGQQIFGHKYSYSSSHIRRLLEIDIGIQCTILCIRVRRNFKLKKSRMISISIFHHQFHWREEPILFFFPTLCGGCGVRGRSDCYIGGKCEGRGAPARVANLACSCISLIL